MPEVYLCPRCGSPVGSDQMYVLAQEYQLAQGFGATAAVTRADLAVGAKRRFHVGHFRGRIDDCYYELIDQ